MLKRFPCGPATNEFTQSIQLGRAQLTFKLKVETQARESEGMGQQELGLEAGRGDSVFGEMACGGIQYRKKIHNIQLRSADAKTGFPAGPGAYEDLRLPNLIRPPVPAAAARKKPDDHATQVNLRALISFWRNSFS